MYVYDIITSVYLKKADLLCVCNYHPWGGELKWEGKCRTPVSELFLSIPVSLPLFLLSSPSSLTFSLSLTPSLCDALFICFIRSFFLSQQTENFWLYVKKINLVWFDHLFWSYILFQQWKKKLIGTMAKSLKKLLKGLYEGEIGKVSLLMRTVTEDCPNKNLSKKTTGFLLKNYIKGISYQLPSNFGMILIVF